MASWAELLKRAEPGEHLVQLYGEDDRLLARNVTRYLAEGLQRLDGLLVIATQEHRDTIARYLAEGSAHATLEAERDGRLRFLDARTTLDGFLRDGVLDKARFEATVGETLRQVRGCSRSGQVRAFGEMVGLLWDEERYAEAEALEQFWNSTLAGAPYSLYCAYRIDLFDGQSNSADLSPIVATHTHLLAGHGTVLSSGRPAN
jgi:MEDS: MEthanogen/methylotroph, DcmR Sensory domain